MPLRREKQALTDAERDFLANYDAARFPRLSVAVDVAIVTCHGHHLKALLVRRTEHPALGRWALPGGFVALDESLGDAAARVLAKKAQLREVFLEQLYTFGAPNRDPRTRVLSVAYYALVDHARLPAPDDARKMAALEVDWEGETGGPARALDADGQPLELAFDHGDILGMAVKRLRGKLDYAPIGFELLPESFTLRALQRVHETILGRTLNKDSFRRRMLQSGEVVPTGNREVEVGHRPAELYKFTPIKHL